jgi:hypothetical protein
VSVDCTGDPLICVEYFLTTQLDRKDLQEFWFPKRIEEMLYSKELDRMAKEDVKNRKQHKAGLIIIIDK